MRFFLITALLIAGPLFSVTGQVRDSEWIRLAREVSALVKTKDYSAALQRISQGTKNPAYEADVCLLRADVYQKMGDREKEIAAIEEGLAIDSTTHTAYFFHLGELYFATGDYVRAQQNYTRYVNRDKKLAYLPAANRKLTNCAFALNALATANRQPVEMYIESPVDVYWPSIDVTGRTFTYTRNSGGQEDIWRYDGTDSRPLNLNTPDGNEGTQSLTADGQMMFFTGCDRPDSRGSCDIYVAYRLADTLWSAPINLGYPICTDAWESQPSVSADGTRLFFASTRYGGRGGSDIWFSTLQQRLPDGRQLWGEPKPLYFNTPDHEMAPFLYYNGKTLFFASSGYPGMGGLDIYRVDLDSVNEPENIGITVNSHGDEMGFIVDATGEWGYFASNKEGTQNIYRYKLDDATRCTEMSYLRLTVVNEEGNRVVPDNLVVVNPENSDTLALYDSTFMPEDMISCLQSNSTALISVQKSGYLYCSDTVQVGRADYAHPQTRRIVVRRIRDGLSHILNGIFFDVDDYSLREASHFELDQVVDFLKNNPSVHIEIAGHTDNSGSAAHNAQLSESRAFEVYKYLFLHHIKKERMSYKGFGATVPVASNDTPEGRAQNRRTEITIREEKAVRK